MSAFEVILSGLIWYVSLLLLYYPLSFSFFNALKIIDQNYPVIVVSVNSRLLKVGSVIFYRVSLSIKLKSFQVEYDKE